VKEKIILAILAIHIAENQIHPFKSYSPEKREVEVDQKWREKEDQVADNSATSGIGVTSETLFYSDMQKRARLDKTHIRLHATLSVHYKYYKKKNKIFSKGYHISLISMTI